MLRRLLVVAGLAATSLAVIPWNSPLSALERPAWPDTPEMRLAALALIQTLNANLLANPSATATLDRWCGDHQLAPAGATIVADRVAGDAKPADAATLQQLQPAPGEAIAYRRVRLTCGTRVLSEADNWYLPSHLTEAMNKELATTNTSFGRVVRPLGFSRKTLEATLLWQPLPESWAMQPAAPAPAGGAALAMPDYLLRHKAVLISADGRPFSVVAENYTSEVLAFPPPALP